MQVTFTFGTATLLLLTGLLSMAFFTPLPASLAYPLAFCFAFIGFYLGKLLKQQLQSSNSKDKEIK